MQIFYDLTLDRLVSSPGNQSDLSTLELKRSPYSLVELQFGRSPQVVSTSVLDAGDTNWTETGFLTFTADASTDKLTFTDVTDLEDDMRIRVFTTDTAPGNVSTATNYFVRDLDATAKTCKLASTSGGSAIDITSAGTGTHTLVFWPDITVGLKADGVYDGDYLAVLETFTADVNRKLYRGYLNLETVQIDALLGHEEPGSGTTFTVDAGTDVVTLTDGDELADGDRARVSSSGTLPAGLAAATDYWWDEANSKFLSSSGGSAVDITDTGTGTHTVTRQPDNTNDVDSIASAMFEVSFRHNPEENEWRPSINQVATTIRHNVNDPDTNQPINTAAPSEGQALLVSGANAGAAMQELLGLKFTDPAEATVSGGVLTLTQSFMTVDTESDSSTDDIDTIIFTGGAGKGVHLLMPENSGRVPTLKHGTDNILTPDGNDIELTAPLWIVNTTAGAYVVADVINAASVTDGGTLGTGLTLPNAGLHLLDTDASHDLIVSPGSNLTADRTLTITTGDADRELTLSGDATISGSNTGDQTITLTGDVTGSGTGSFAATIANKTGSDTDVVTGTAGTSGNLVMWNADGDAVDSSVAASSIPSTQYRTVELPLSEFVASTGTPSLETVTFSGTAFDIQCWKFATTEFIQGAWMIPSDCDVTDPVEIRLIWSQDHANSGTVQWRINSFWTAGGGNGETISGSADLSTTLADGSNGDDGISITGNGTLISASSVTANELFIFNIGRLSSGDTMTGDASLMKVVVRYTVSPDTDGSW